MTRALRAGPLARRLSILAMLVSFALSLMPAHAGTTRESDEAKVQHVLQEFVAGIETGNAARIGAVLEDDATLFWPGPPATPHRTKSRASIQAMFGESFAARPKPPAPGSTIKIEPKELVIEISGDVALATFELASPPPPGQSARLGRRTFVLRRHGDEWKVWHLHASNRDL
ncbi:MAG TPA: nuclear transport factor 2 family protein [Alphaproteobacteria bacterium]|nr:nuclear transport factor 2 family protein [Alphaproteobacteria bacterium]